MQQTQRKRGPAEQYGTSTTRPPDFDQFWNAIMAEAAAIPLNPAMEHVPLRSTDEVDVYEIHYDSLDLVLSRPEVDRARIGVHGSSQGGALTVTTAALRRDAITCGAAGAPYLCGFMDAAALTRSWPYEEINDYLRLYPEREPQVRETL